MSELIIRAGLHDEALVADLLMQGGSPFRRPTLSRLVVDLPNAIDSDAFFNSAQSAGVPFVVDPMTVLTQGTVREGDRWLRLPFAQPEPMSVETLTANLAGLVEQVVQAQVEASATVIIPPYFVVEQPGSPAFDLAIASVQATAEFCRTNNIRLKLMPILCAQIKAFGPENTWASGVDRFAGTVADLDVDVVAACFGPAGDGEDSIAKVSSVFGAMLRLQAASGHGVVAWRQYESRGVVGFA